MRPLQSLFFVAFVLVLIEMGNAEENKQDMKRRYNSKPLNPYSWQRNRDRRSFDELDEAILVPISSKRGYRNPYSWLRTANIDVEEPGFFDALFGAAKDKKSPYLMSYRDDRPARNPYSWKNFI